MHLGTCINTLTFEKIQEERCSVDLSYSSSTALKVKVYIETPYHNTHMQLMLVNMDP